MSWINPVPAGHETQDFGPSPLGVEGPMYATSRKAHDISPYDGGGYFTGSTYYAHFHGAIDIAAVEGTAIVAPQSGLVLDAKWGGPGTWANGGGWFVRVLVNENCMYLVAHCQTLKVLEGEYVRKGDVIARVGQTGVATGPHTHFWVRYGPRPYYDPDAFFFDPHLVLPGGAYYGDAKWEPGAGGSIPDTSTTTGVIAMGDLQRKFRSLLDAGKARKVHVKRHKPIRKKATVASKVLATTDDNGRDLWAVGLIDVDKLPDSEAPFGDVYVVEFFDGGTQFAYVKAVDIVGG